ncbi:MAG TPA: LacI family DNA-binding transcriptional regulator [Chloroflexota bacterium]|nr:LacI family DNA-binding transcriptional regulator [Chloroflexota bacterium]
MTLKEVAAALRVSPMTVSNAYNRPDRIARATRERVLREAARLGYPGPHPTARHLRTGRAGAVGILYAGPLSFAFSDPAAVLFLQGVSLATEAARLGLLLLSGATVDPRNVMGAAIDGLIVQALAEDDPLLRAALGRHLPLVLVDQPAPAGLPAVGIDDACAARAAAQHLLTLGHRRLGIIALGREQDGPVDAAGAVALSNPVARARWRGYAAALSEAGVPWAAVSLYACAALTLADGARAARWLLRQVPRPTALLAMSDQHALGALDAARMLDLSVPGDLSVVGFDDVPAAARAEPGLTTVRQPHVHKGQRAAELLVASLRGEGEREPASVLLPTELIVRGSTAPPRA